VLKFALLFLFYFQTQFLSAQPYDLLIKGGHVIDPKNGINGSFDIAISHGKIADIGKNLDVKNARQVLDASGLLVVPGLIDIHTHDFYGTDTERFYCNGTESVRPDDISFCSGVTTVVDAGSSGWRDFPLFKEKVIDHSQTRVFAFLNIVGAGMRGAAYEQDTIDMDAEKTAATASKYCEEIVGIKIAHYKGKEWKPVDEAIHAGRLAKIPVMIDFGDNPNPLSVEELFMQHMRPGDIFTHCYAELKGRDCVVDQKKQELKAFVWEARKRGIGFDVGYGEISFAFSQAIPAVRAGFYPSSISTDMHSFHKMKAASILNIMSEFLAMGMNIQEIIQTVTWNPAREIMHEELGNLSKKAVADITILDLCKTKSNFYDHTGFKVEGAESFKCAFTIRNGKIVYSSNKKAKLVI
jgi:dihydroorotase